MQSLTVVNADADRYGALRENIFIALDGNGQYLGSLLIYPFFAYDTEPEHPHNLYLHLHAEREEGPSEPVKDLLLEHALRRAAQIKSDAEQTKTRVYACLLKHQQAEIAYFLQRGFTHDEGMYILERPESVGLPHVEVPEGVSVQPWRMETDAEQRRFIEVHRQVFPRHPYSIERLRELMSLPGWTNFTAFDHTGIAGSVMVFVKRDGDTVGYVEDLFVQRRWRTRGIGRYLLYVALAHFRGIGIHRVQLEHWSANKPALRLYRGFGFSPIDETEIAVGRYV